MSEKRVYSQSDLVNMFGVERRRVRSLMYNNDISIKNQYCPYMGVTKSGYLLNISDLKIYAKEISLEKDSKNKYYVAVKGDNPEHYFFIQLEDGIILNKNYQNNLFCFIETKLIDINHAFNHNIEGFPNVSEKDMIKGLNFLGINYKLFK